MKRLLLCIIFLCSMPAFAQNKQFAGRVLDGDNNTGIPFCVVKAKDRNEGIYTDENGRFSFNANTDSVKTLIFYSLGYAPLEMQAMAFPKDSAVIKLHKQSTNLKEVVYAADKGKIKHKILGRKKEKHIGDCYQKYGEEDAMFLHNNRRGNCFLKEIYVYITNEGIPDTKFRIHVYERDPATNMPGYELTDTNLIVHANTGNEWVKADLSTKRIPIGPGVFISIEWIAGHGNNDAALQSGKHAEVTNHNGQVLGLQRNYGVPFMYHRYPFHTEWVSNWDINLNPALCPMIYGTYTYTK